MTTRPFSPCRSQGRSRRQGEPSAHARGYDRWWREVATRRLSRDPLCGDHDPRIPETFDSLCVKQGRIVAPTQVDHVQPWRGNEKLRRSKLNRQSLCGRCHQAKTMRERGARFPTRSQNLPGRPSPGPRRPLSLTGALRGRGGGGGGRMTSRNLVRSLSCRTVRRRRNRRSSKGVTVKSGATVTLQAFIGAKGRTKRRARRSQVLSRKVSFEREMNDG